MLRSVTAPAWSAPAWSLLRRSHGFEGLSRVQIDARSRESMIGSEVSDPCGRLIELEAADPTTNVDATRDDHDVTVLTDAVDPVLPLRELLVKLAQPLSNPRLAPVGRSRHRRERRLQLKIGIEKLRWHRPVSSVEQLDEGPNDLDVLLRHRLPSFLGAAFGVSSGLVGVRIGGHPRDHVTHSGGSWTPRSSSLSIAPTRTQGASGAASDLQGEKAAVTGRKSNGRIRVSSGRQKSLPTALLPARVLPIRSCALGYGFAVSHGVKATVPMAVLQA